MKPLSWVRDQWIEAADLIEEMETKWARYQTIHESVHHFIEMFEFWLPTIRETEPLFGPEREEHMIELQRRLQRLADWQRDKRGEAIRRSRAASEPAQ
jgi:uncharacterized damage-inducible protein DinB